MRRCLTLATITALALACVEEVVEAPRPPEATVHPTAAASAAAPKAAARLRRPRHRASPVRPREVLAAAATASAADTATAAQWLVASSPRPAGDPPARTGAPTLHVTDDAAGKDQLPLAASSATVDIAGVIAQVRLRQTYVNTKASPIEAEYVFPASTRAAVHAMRLKVGERSVEAEVAERQQARENYAQARQQGKRAALLEEERPNVLSMHVANIMPGDRIEVELDYSELLVPQDGHWELVIPTVVGPRYLGGVDVRQDAWMLAPTLPPGAQTPFSTAVEVTLNAGMPIRDVVSPSHQLDITRIAVDRAQVRPRDPAGDDRDFILRYRLADKAIETGLLLWQGEEESAFALLVEPPQVTRPEQVSPREYIFVLDVSGSMDGFPLDTAKELMRNLLGAIRSHDRLNVVLFAGDSSVLAPGGSLPATPANIDRALAHVDSASGAGGTELMAGLQVAYDIPRRGDISRSVVVVTDGYVGVERQSFRFVRERLDRTNLFAFGVGGSVNRHLIEGLARAGCGEPFVVTSSAEASAAAAKFSTYILAPILTGVTVRFEGFDAIDVAPERIPDLMARRPLVLIGRYRGAASGQVVLSGKTPEGPWSTTIPVRPEAVRSEHLPLRWLWARTWVATLEDELAMAPHAGLASAVTSLGLAYSLLTRFTAFVAIDSEVVNPSGKGDTVQQPQPSPQGVAGLAAGAEARETALAPARAGWALAQVGHGSSMPLSTIMAGDTGALACKMAIAMSGSGRYATLGKGREIGKKVAAVKTFTGQSTGGCGKGDIAKKVKAQVAALRSCYEMQLVSKPSLQGKITAQWTIDAEGAVKSPEIVSDSMGDDSVADCVVRAIGRIRFSKPTKGICVIQRPFVFSPG